MPLRQRYCLETASRAIPKPFHIIVIFADPALYLGFSKLARLGKWRRLHAQTLSDDKQQLLFLSVREISEGGFDFEKGGHELILSHYLVNGIGRRITSWSEQVIEDIDRRVVPERREPSL